MPEIGRPTTSQEMQYRQVQMAPKSLAGKGMSEARQREEIINRATGNKPKNELYKDGPHNQMGKDEFMKLLTFQLQNQDPMNPMDQSKFTGELAQFSQLEQLTNLNKKFDDANKTQSLQDKFYAASFVGKKVVTSGTTIDLKDHGEKGDVLFKLDDSASKVLVRILDSKNNIMGEIWRDGLSEGSHQVTWDGVALDGTPAVKGKYTVQVKAWKENGEEVGTRTEATGVVQSVAFDEGVPVLTVDGQKVYLRDVTSFHTPDTKTHTTTNQVLNSDLSGQAAPMVQSKSTKTAAQAANAYAEGAGIYD
jgi:flagellar basal-body rod modification protein FlgD